MAFCTCTRTSVAAAVILGYRCDAFRLDTFTRQRSESVLSRGSGVLAEITNLTLDRSRDSLRVHSASVILFNAGFVLYQTATNQLSLSPAL